MKKGFTLLEIAVVIVIIGVMAALAVPAYQKAKEIAFDNQARADLKLIVMSEKSYNFEMDYYYPSAASETNIVAINNNLGLTLSADSNRAWNYTVKSTGTPCAQASRFNGPDTRSWHMNFTNDVTPTNTACPS